MAKFFINRPIFAWVIAIVIMLAGTLSILNLPVSMYPQIAPPQVSISATYPGASAKTIEDTVVQVIEQKMTGLDGYLYMSSTSESSGRINITLNHFRQGRLCLRQTVLHLHLSHVRVGTGCKGQRNVDSAARFTGRTHIQITIQAGHLLFNDLDDVIFNRLAEAPG